MNFIECPNQNLLSLDLNQLREGSSTTSLGNKFQAFTTLFENTFAQTFNLDRFLKKPSKVILTFILADLISKYLYQGT